MRITEIMLRAHMGRGNITRITGYCVFDNYRIHDIQTNKVTVFDNEDIIYIMNGIVEDICEAYKTLILKSDVRNYMTDNGDFVRRYYI